MIVFFEGLDGSGKTTVSKRVAEMLRERGLTVCHTRAPGGTPAAERIRGLLMGDEKLHPDTILLLFSAAANEQKQFIEEQEKTCDVVVCDRWLFSTFAYQIAMGADQDLVMDMVEKVMFMPYDPRLAIFLDATPEMREQRIYDRGGDKDRFSAFPKFVRARLQDNYAAMLEAGWLSWHDAKYDAETVARNCESLVIGFRDAYSPFENLPDIAIPEQAPGQP